MRVEGDELGHDVDCFAFGGGTGLGDHGGGEHVVWVRMFEEEVAEAGYHRGVSMAVVEEGGGGFWMT